MTLMPRLTCYYVDLVNVTYLPNYACLKLIVLNFMAYGSAAKVQYHCVKAEHIKSYLDMVVVITCTNNFELGLNLTLFYTIQIGVQLQP